MGTAKAARLSGAARLLLATAGIAGTLIVGSFMFFAPLSANAAATWANTLVSAQTGTFTATFDAIPSQNKEDAVIALSPAAANGYASLAAIARFNPSGTIDARKAGAYTADASLVYSAGTSYHFRMVVNVPSKTYSVFVTAPGKSEVAIATNYAFRSEQSSASALKYWVSYAEVGNVSVNNFAISGGTTPTPAPKPVPTPTPTPTPTPAPTPTPTPVSGGSNYDSVVLADKPVMFLDMNTPSASGETDKTGNGHNGTYKGGAAKSATLPNGETAADFNGSSQYLTVPSSAALSITNTHKFTWEAWIKADNYNFGGQSGDGYVDWMGKCENYSPTCEWEARAYAAQTAENRPYRLSAYVFNPSAGLGSGADWQPASGQISAGQWLHVVGEYDMDTTPSGCGSSAPGNIQIWVNGVKWSMANHLDTGCMSQYSVKPKAGSSPLNIGTMAMDTFFPGAVGKVAIYNTLLSQAQITAHYQAMTGKTPAGTCGNTCTLK